MRHTLSCNLNDGNDDQRKLLELIAAELEDRGISVSSLIGEALAVYFGCERTQQEQIVTVDNTEVLERIERKLDALTRRGVAPQQEETVVMPGGIEATLEEIDPNANTPFIIGVRSGARPGMRLDD